MPTDPQILLIAPQPFFAERGTPLNVKALAESLGGEGLHVDLLVYPRGENISLPGVRIVRAFGSFLFSLGLIKTVPVGPSLQKIVLDFFLFFSALKLVFSNNYRVVHGIEEGALLAGLFSSIKKSKFIYDMDSYMPEQLREKGGPLWRFIAMPVEFLESLVMRKADAVLTVCASLTSKAKELVEEERVFQIEDFPIDKVCPSYRAEQIRSELGLEGATTIVYTGNFQSYQGVELLLEAIAEVKKSVLETHNLKLLLVGGGSEQDSLYAKIEALISSKGLASSVLMTGDRPLESMHAYMALGDILASPRVKGENTPLKIYSYMDADRPILATKIYSHTQVLDETNSFLTEPTAIGLAGGIEEILSSKDEASRRSTRAHELVNKSYSKEAFREKLLQLYKFVAPELFSSVRGDSGKTDL